MKTMLERGAGVLLPISSLASPYGIGTFGVCAYRFIDDLHQAGQRYWQVLPMGPTSYADSPYQSFSAFAGNPYFIDLDFLIQEGLLESEFVKSFSWGEDEKDVDYALIFENRFVVLRDAFAKKNHQGCEEYKAFCEEHAFWLDDYCLYMACKTHFKNREWLVWPEAIKLRKAETLKEYKLLLQSDIEFWKFCQYKFFEQWKKVKGYANQKGIQIIGDIPIYVALDSADVWVQPHLFQLDPVTSAPVNVAGVPPDAFSEDGQLWGNPLYNWEVMELDGFAWWKKRMEACIRLYDVIRIDHFLGVVRYFAIPGDALDGKVGEYRDGPGMKLIDAIHPILEKAKIIAEDLGISNEKVKQILEETNYPGMKVLEFAFSGDRKNEHLPHNYTPNMVVYGGTHDNETIVGYLENCPEWELNYLMEYVDTWDRDRLLNKLFQLAYGSVASVVILQMQDILGLRNDARMNYPSTIGTNWRWRMRSQSFGHEQIGMLGRLVNLYGR